MSFDQHGRIAAISLALALASPAWAASDLVVSQVYGGAGSASSTHNQDFVELFNRGTAPISLSGLTIQYASATGTGHFSVGATLPATTLAPGKYFLVGLAAGDGAEPLPTPDASGTTAMAGTTGKVALVNSSSALACNGGSTPCSAPQLAQIVDLVGYGTADFHEGTGTVLSLGVTRSAQRDGNGCIDTDQNGADFVATTPAPRNSATAAQVCGLNTEPLLSVSDTRLNEGDSGNHSAVFTVTLDRPAGPGGVSIRWATIDGSATADDIDYIASMGFTTISEGTSSVTVGGLVVGDVAPEPDETFVMRITQASNATLVDPDGVATLVNDDSSEVSIAEVQGSAATSSAIGAVLTVEGIVTAHKFNNGFFLQTPDAEVDADPATSEGIFVFTSTPPPASAAVGNRVRVTGTVAEFTPASNPHQMPITQIIAPTVTQLSTGNALPTPVMLNALFSATATPNTAERLEGMRVRVDNAVVVAPSEASLSEVDANATTTGVFHVVLAGVERPFREAGVSAMTAITIPGGKYPVVFDTNQERLMVRSRGQVGATPVAVDTGATVSGMIGVMDYFNGTWALLPDVGSGTVAGGRAPQAVGDAQEGEATIAGFNLLRFYDEVDDGNGAVTLTAAGLDKRLGKTAWAICDYLKVPDIVGVVEVENQRVLGLLADRIAATCESAPQYVPYVMSGNDPGGINVGFLVNTQASGGIPRVEVQGITQHGKDTLFSHPDGSTSLLNDRPPLMLRAVVTPLDGEPYPVTVIVNHLRSLNGADSIAPGSNGWETEGHRVRAKRARQAEFLANLVESRQAADPGERIVLLGDFNAFEFNDFLTDVMGIVTGTQAPPVYVLDYVDSPITLPLTNLTASRPAAERYSYSFEGNAQSLDHIVVNQAILDRSSTVRIEHARINADFGGDNFGDAAVPVRVSDHDPVVLFLAPADTGNADLEAFVGGISEATAGQAVEWEVALINNGPTTARGIVVDISVNAELPGLVLTPPAGVTCDAAQVSNGETRASCRMSSLAHAQPDLVRIDVASLTDAAQAGITLNLVAEVRGLKPDDNPGNNLAFLPTALTEPKADLALVQQDSPQGLTFGAKSTLSYRVLNLGRDPAASPRVVLTLTAVDTKVKPFAPLWNCELTAADKVSQRWTCDFDGDEYFQVYDMVLRFDLSSRSSTPVVAAAIVSSATDDPGSMNNDEHSTHLVLVRTTH